jgi:hypothetical protein
MIPTSIRFLFRNFSASALALLAFASSGCASIVHNGNREVALTSTPTAAKVSVYRLDKKEGPVLVTTQTTPCALSLKPKGGFFKGQPYRLTFELPGHQPANVELTPKLSGWYFGNIVFGGLIGILIVDPATGAMWNLSAEKIDQPLTPDQHALLHTGEGIMVKLASQTTPSEAASLVRIK